MVSFSTVVASFAALAAVCSAAPNRHGIWARHDHKLVKRQAYGGSSNSSAVYVPGPTGTGSVRPMQSVTSTINSYTTTCVTLTYTLGNGRPVTTTITKTIPVPVATTPSEGESPLVPHKSSYAAPGPVETSESEEVSPKEEQPSPIDSEASPEEQAKPQQVITLTKTVTEATTVTHCPASKMEDSTTTLLLTSTVFIHRTVTSFAPKKTPRPNHSAVAPGQAKDKTTVVTMTHTRPRYGHGPYNNDTGAPVAPVGPTGTAVLPPAYGHY